jgi:hypothetical protein
MNKDDYLKGFNSFLDNKLFNQFVVLSGKYLSQQTKLDILDELAYRLQIEFGKKVYLLTNEDIDCEVSVINQQTTPQEIPLIVNRDESVILVLIRTDYFNRNDSWEIESLRVLKYYKYPIFGFCSMFQDVMYYEK